MYRRPYTARDVVRDMTRASGSPTCRRPQNEGIEKATCRKDTPLLEQVNHADRKPIGVSGRLVAAALRAAGHPAASW